MVTSNDVQSSGLRLNPEFKNYWVLFIDLAGFSELMLSPQGRDVIALAYAEIASGLAVRAPFSDLLDEVLKKAEESHKAGSSEPASWRPIIEKSASLWSTRVKIFSDSIFFFFDGQETKYNPWTSAMMLGYTALATSALLWSRGIPHRGGISYGACYLDSTGSVFLGEPIVRAYKWEQEQEWFGISIEPGSVAAAASLRQSWLLMDYCVPTKSGGIPTACIAPPLLLTSTRELVIAGFVQAYERAVERRVFGAISRYVQTARYCCEVPLVDQRLRAIAAL